jgi:hypothetical protein
VGIVDSESHVKSIATKGATKGERK